MNDGDPTTPWPQPLVPREDLRRVDQMVTDERGFHPIDEPDPDAGAARHRHRHLCLGWREEDGEDRLCLEPAIFFERDERFVDRLCESCWRELTPASRDRHAARPPRLSSRIFGTSDWRSGEIAFWRTGVDWWNAATVTLVNGIRALPDAEFARVRWFVEFGYIDLWVTGADLRRSTEMVLSPQGFHPRGEPTDPAREARAHAEARRSREPCGVRGGTCAGPALFFARLPLLSSDRILSPRDACMPCWRALSQVERDLYAARAPAPVPVSDETSGPSAWPPHPRRRHACRARGRTCMGFSTHFALDDRATHGHVCATCWHDLPRAERDLYEDSDRAPVVDGLSPLDCRVRWIQNRERVEAGFAPMFPLTEAQVVEGRRSMELSADLRARALRDRIRAQAQRERDRVRVDLEFEPWE